MWSFRHAASGSLGPLLFERSPCVRECQRYAAANLPSYWHLVTDVSHGGFDRGHGSMPGDDGEEGFREGSKYHTWKFGHCTVPTPQIVEFTGFKSLQENYLTRLKTWVDEACAALQNWMWDDVLAQDDQVYYTVRDVKMVLDDLAVLLTPHLLSQPNEPEWPFSWSQFEVMAWNLKSVFFWAVNGAWLLNSSSRHSYLVTFWELEFASSNQLLNFISCCMWRLKLFRNWRQSCFQQIQHSKQSTRTLPIWWKKLVQHSNGWLFGAGRFWVRCYEIWRGHFVGKSPCLPDFARSRLFLSVFVCILILSCWQNGPNLSGLRFQALAVSGMFLCYEGPFQRLIVRSFPMTVLNWFKFFPCHCQAASLLLWS